jgi:gas vesicle protein
MERSDYVRSFLLGGLVGAGVALLLAPRAGRDLRRLIGDKGRELASDAASFVDEQRQALAWRKDRLKAAIEAGQQTYREEKGQA